MNPNYNVVFIIIAALLLTLTLSCKKDPQKAIPTLSTIAISAISDVSAITGGNITSDGGAAVTARGVCWGLNQNPTTSENKTSDGSGAGTFTSSITGLISGTTYYIRAYATNSAGTAYGNEITTITESKQVEKNIIASAGGTLTTSDSIQLVIPANALPNNGIVFIGRTGNEPTTVPNPDLEIVGSPITMRLPSDAILKPLQLSFPAPSGPTGTYGVFIYNGSTYYPVEYTINGGTVNASIDIINWDKTSVNNKSSSNDLIITGIKNNKTPSETGMGLKEAIIESGTMKFYVPQADSSSRILLLIHGFWSDPTTWTIFLQNIYSANLSYTDYWTFGYNTSKHIKENADLLDALLAQYSKGATIDIVAHSMGGLVARSEIEKYKDHMYINRLVTLGTPHQGTDPAIFPYLYGYIIDNLYGGFFNMNDAGLRDLSPSSDFIINDMWAMVKPPIPYYTIAAKNTLFWDHWWYPSIIIDGEDDGLVSVISAKGVKGATSPLGEVVEINKARAHNEMPKDSRIFDQVTSYLKGQAPSVTTTTVTTYNSTSATVGGTVTGDGGVSVIETGIYWGTDPLVLGTKRQIGIGTGVFSTSLTGLTPNTKYHIVAYAINSQGIGYGDQVNFTTGVIPIPLAAFIAIPTTITLGQSVQFSDQSTNTPTSWFWNFGDGSTATTKNPSHIYTSAGTYTVILTATNSYGYNSETKTNYITVNSAGGGIIFNPDLTYGSVTDIDGNVYKTIVIGTQTWMAENLKTTKYRNGNSIGTTIPASLNTTAESTPKYQWAYAGNESNVATYGRLYTWYAATDSRNVCPTGWHLPTDTEWNILTTYLGGEGAGGKLKESGTTHWNTPNTGATNSSGFTALPGGYRYYDGTFINIGSYGYWWSPEHVTGGAWARAMYYNFIGASRYYDGESSGFSVRCLRDM